MLALLLASCVAQAAPAVPEAAAALARGDAAHAALDSGRRGGSTSGRWPSSPRASKGAGGSPTC